MAITAAAFFAAGCGKNQNQAAWWQGEQERIALSHQLGLKEYRFEQVHTHDFEELQGLRKAVEAATSALRSLRQQQLSLSVEVVSLEGTWGGFREAAIRNQRQRAIGKAFETIQLVSGRKFQQVRVSAIDDAGVTIRHADGSARLRFADLNAEQQVVFGLEADLALAATGREADAVAHYERWVDEQMTVVHEKAKIDSEIARGDEVAARQQRSQLASQQAAVSETRALAQAATSVGSSWGYSRYYSNYRTYRPTYYNVYDSAPSSRSKDWGTAVSARPVVPQFTRSTGTGCASPVMEPKCRSFANTTLPSIP